jgi:predicted Zn finger-like uncharacterized protein
MIHFNCEHCGTGLTTPYGNKGKRIRCPECRKMVSVPDPADVPIPIECPECGASVMVRTHDLGSRIGCPSCKQLILVPTAEDLASGSGAVSTSRCAVCGLRAKPEIRCSGCHARFCSEACRAQHRESSPHGCGMLLLAMLVVGLGLVGGSLAVLGRAF